MIDYPSGTNPRKSDVGKYAADMAKDPKDYGGLEQETSDPFETPSGHKDPAEIREGGYQIGDGKYVVFKVEDFYTMMGRLALPPAWGVDDNNDVIGANLDCAVLAEEITRVAKELEVPDATVLRDQDLLTAPALNAYADSALILHDLLAHYRQGGFESLLDRCEFFRARAVRAQQHPNRKLPD